jgi:hypothetical protein
MRERLMKITALLLSSAFVTCSMNAAAQGALDTPEDVSSVTVSDSAAEAKAQEDDPSGTSAEAQSLPEDTAADTGKVEEVQTDNSSADGDQDKTLAQASEDGALVTDGGTLFSEGTEVL